MGYVVVKYGNKFSYPIKSTANKPRLCINSGGGVSYIPLKTGTGTNATRLGFNINNVHYRVGGETTTTSIQSNTTYTYLGNKTYKTARTTYSLTNNTTRSYNDYFYYFTTSRSTTLAIDNSISSYTYWSQSFYTISSLNYVTYSTSRRYGNGPYNYTETYFTTSVYNTSDFGGSMTLSQKNGVATELISSKTELWHPVYNVTVTRTKSSWRESITYSTFYKLHTAVIGSCTSKITKLSTWRYTRSYDYGYDVLTGNTTTSVQTTTED